MSISTKLLLKHSQQLKMTPQLQQAIRLLQYSNLELIQFVEAEVKSNPLLEVKDEDNAEDSLSHKNDPNVGEDTKAQTVQEEFRALDFENSPLSEDPGLIETDNQEFSLDDSFASSQRDWKNSTLSQSNGSQRAMEADDNNIENFSKPETTLKEHLTNQMLLALSGQQERLIAGHLIDMVDEAGYLHADIEDIEQKLSAPQGTGLKVLQVLQTFEPCGVFARSLSECLSLQLKDKNRYDPLIASLLDNLDLVANKKIDALCKTVGVDKQEIVDMVEEIKNLNPKPGLAFGSTRIEPIVPDIIVRVTVDGGWSVELNNDTLPRLLINHSYYTKVLGTKPKGQEKSYIHECLQSASWLVKCLDQRAQTILKVAREIVRQQDAFLTLGVQHLKPMNLKTIAEAISMHESTISRVTSNKYIATPRGIFELKYFFTSALPASKNNEEAHSSKAVQHRIKELIESEATSTILSDDMIVEKLKNDGVDIARRTVAKYRETMRIPSSVQRKRDKKFQVEISHPN